MNWKEIKENSPESLHKAEDSLKTIDYPMHPDYGRIERIRELYDFFDKQELIIDIGYSKFSMETGKWKFTASICNKRTKDRINTDGFESRTEAETAAFTKAFEILNNNLKK